MKKVILLDGGMGQELLRRWGGEPTPLWSAEIMLNEPELVCDLHLDYIHAGAQVLTLNTYSATPERLHRHNAMDQFSSIHQSAISAAQQAISVAEVEGVSIAACLPPLVASYRPDVSLPFEQSLETYRRLVELQAPAADLILCETMASVNDARAAATAGRESGKPVWLALTISDHHANQLRSGEPLQGALEQLAELDVDAILLNCSHPEAISNAWQCMRHLTTQTGAYGNAFVTVEPLQPGGTVKQLQARKDLDPAAYANFAMRWVEQGASIIGGCCEIGPEHIRALHGRLIEDDRL